MIQKTKDWKDILNFYQDLKNQHSWDLQPMIDLVSMICQSNYKTGIHAYISHSTLCIGQHRQLSDSNALLKITHDSKNKSVVFEYKGDMTIQYSWNKTFPQEDVIKEFKRFLPELKWII